MDKNNTMPETLTAYGEREGETTIRRVDTTCKPVYTSSRMSDIHFNACALEAMRVFGGDDLRGAHEVWDGLIAQSGNLYLADTEGYECYDSEGSMYMARTVEVVKAYGDERLVIAVYHEDGNQWAYYERQETT